MRKIHCLNPISKLGTGLLTENYEMTDNLAEAEGILVRSAAMHDLELPKGLRAVARAGAGVNNIPLDKCAEAGVVVFNTPGANANGVKELVLAGMLLGARDVVGGIDWCKEQKDNENISKDMEKAKKKFAGHEIRGKKLGVIGLGAIGAEVANAAAALGMEVYGYDPFISVKAAWMLSRDVKHITSVDTIYQDGVVILNFARDLLVNDDDMAEALASGRVKRYITDFPNAKVMQMPNVIATPHLGASTEESEDNCAVMAVKELMDYLDNGNIKNSVNFPNCDMGVCTTVGRLALLHKNVPNMIGQISSILASTDMNIANMTNKSRDKYAYTLVDLETKADAATIEKLKAIQGMMRVRVIK